jgi:DNA repair protein RecO (recombination protein O)
VALATTRALVLQAFAYSETSKVLRLYTLEHGLQSVIARGALRPRSRYGGVLEPFTEGSATFYHREGRDLHTLSGFDLLRSRQALGRSLVAFAGASLQAELVIRTATEEPHPTLYHTLVDAWDALAAATEEGVLATALTGIWSVISVQGLAPEAAACIRCGRALAVDEPARFDAAGGGTACTRCRPAGRVLDAATRGELRADGGGRRPGGRWSIPERTGRSSSPTCRRSWRRSAPCARWSCSWRAPPPPIAPRRRSRPARRLTPRPRGGYVHR